MLDSSNLFSLFFRFLLLELALASVKDRTYLEEGSFRHKNIFDNKSNISTSNSNFSFILV